MKTIIAIFLLTLTTLAFSADRNAAYNLICKPLPFESERAKCVSIIKPHNYFDDEALTMCSQFPFTSTKLECLGYIGGKSYEAYEIDVCKGTVFDTKRLECLRDNGSAHEDNCIPNQEVLSQLRSAQYELRQGQTGTVDKRLTYLISKFSNPSCQ